MSRCLCLIALTWLMLLAAGPVAAEPVPREQTVALIIHDETAAAGLLEAQLLAVLGAGGFETLERGRLRDVLAEQRLGAAQLEADRASRVRLGQVLAAEALALATVIAGQDDEVFVHLRIVDARHGLVLDEELFAWSPEAGLPTRVEALIEGARRRLEIAPGDRLYVTLPRVTWQATPPDEQTALAAMLELALRGELHGDPRVYLLERAALLELVREQWLAELPVELRPTAVMIEMTLQPTADPAVVDLAMRVSEPGVEPPAVRRREVPAQVEALRDAALALLEELVDREAAVVPFDREAERDRLSARIVDLQRAGRYVAAREAAEAGIALSMDEPRQMMRMIAWASRNLWLDGVRGDARQQALDKFIWLGELSLHATRLAIEARQSWILEQGTVPNRNDLGSLRPLRHDPELGPSVRQVLNLSTRQIELLLNHADVFDSSAAATLARAIDTLGMRTFPAEAFTREAIELLTLARQDAERFDLDWRGNEPEPGSRQLGGYIRLRRLVVYGFSPRDVTDLFQWCLDHGEYDLKLIGLAGLAWASESADEVQALAERVMRIALTGEHVFDAQGARRYRLDGGPDVDALLTVERELERVGRLEAAIDTLLEHFEEHGDFDALARMRGPRHGTRYHVFVERMIGGDMPRLHRLIRAMEQHEAADEAADASQRALYRQLQRRVNRLTWLRRGQWEAGPLWRQIQLERVRFTSDDERLGGAILRTFYLHEPVDGEPALYLGWNLNPTEPANDAKFLFTRSSPEGGRLEPVAEATVPGPRWRHDLHSRMHVHGQQLLLTGAGRSGIWSVDADTSRLLDPPEPDAQVHALKIVDDVAVVLTGAPHRTLHQLYRYDMHTKTYDLIADHRSMAPRSAIDGLARMDVRAMIPDHEHGWLYLHIDARDTDKHGIWRYRPRDGELQFITQARRQSAESVSLLTFHNGELVYHSTGNRRLIDRDSGEVIDDNHYPDNWPRRVEGVSNILWPRQYVRIGEMFLNHHDVNRTLRLVHPEHGVEAHPNEMLAYFHARETDYGVWMIGPEVRSTNPPLQIYRVRLKRPE